MPEAEVRCLLQLLLHLIFFNTEVLTNLEHTAPGTLLSPPHQH